MANTREMTDEEILRQASLVEEMSYDCEIGTFGGFSCGDNSPSIESVSSVLRDYVRIRKENAELTAHKALLTKPHLCPKCGNWTKDGCSVGGCADFNEKNEQK